MKTFQPNYFKSAICAFAGLFLSISSVVGIRWMFTSPAFNYFRENDWIKGKTVLLMFFCLLLFGIFLLWLSLPVTIVLTENSICRKGLFWTREILLSDIKGYVQWKFFVLIIGNSMAIKPIRTPLFLKGRDELIQHVATYFTKINPKNRSVINENFLDDESFGATREEREIRIRNTKSAIRFLGISGIAAGIWLLKIPFFQTLPAFICLFILPVSYFYLWKISNGFRVPISEMEALLLGIGTGIMPVFSLVFTKFASAAPLSNSDFFVATAVFAAVLFPTFYFLPSTQIFGKTGKIKTLTVLIFFSGLYSFGIVKVFNHIFDFREPDVHFLKVQRLQDHNLIGRETRTLVLEPLGADKSATHLSVSDSEHQNIRVGDTVKINLHKGALGIRWMELAE